MGLMDLLGQLGLMDLLGQLGLMELFILSFLYFEPDLFYFTLTEIHLTYRPWEELE